jgi:hypothetical protein
MATRYAQTRTIDTQLIVHAPYQGKPSRDFGIYDKAEGFSFTSEKVSYGEAPVAAGVASREDVTLRRPFSQFSPEEEAWLEAHQGRDCTVVRSFRGDDKLAMGKPRTYTGVVLGVDSPDSDRTASERAETAVTIALNVSAT